MNGTPTAWSESVKRRNLVAIPSLGGRAGLRLGR